MHGAEGRPSSVNSLVQLRHNNFDHREVYQSPVWKISDEKTVQIRRALLNAAKRDLRHARKVLGHGRTDALRCAPFRAQYRGACPRCRKRIDIWRRHQVSQRFCRPGPC